MRMRLGYSNRVETQPIVSQIAILAESLEGHTVGIIGLRQITKSHKNIDEADVSLLVQQLGGDRAECSLKVLPIPRHGLCHSLSHLGFPCT
jgi:hypothetical protein